ncbi:hypothetical protein [Ramlibacter sp. AN1133]|uniref:hypothetical protein n=1 Tax=Ramlibacter sp. AN1133 TaxID=3133429 RepID=UPI0030BF481E
MTTLRVALAGLALAATGVSAQSIPAPAGSTDTGSRATVGIAPVDTSSFATRSDVTNVANTANLAYSLSLTASSAVAPWSRAFAGQTRQGCGGVLGCAAATIDANGFVSWRMTNSNTWAPLGYPSNSTCVGFSSGFTNSTDFSVAVCPSGFDVSGRATNWLVQFNSVNSFAAP